MRKLTKIILITFLASSFFSALWAYFLYKNIHDRLQKNWFPQPIEIYSQPQKYYVNQFLNPSELEQKLLSLSYRKREEGQKLFVKDYSFWSKEECQIHINQKLSEDIKNCLIFLPPTHTFTSSTLENPNMLIFSKDNKISSIYQKEPFQPTHIATLEPELFAQLYSQQMILREITPLSDTPLYCSQAVTAIEDKDFLTHPGISLTSMVRALFQVLIHGRFVQGGSTITQQLVKNYFLTQEKTLRRKLTEVVMAMILETQLSKEQILENYMNTIYMGQSGPFEVRGFGSAAKYYFNKSLHSLNLPECAFLAAALNSPGRYNPWEHPLRALQRRNLVLKKMYEENMITEKQWESSQKERLTATSSLKNPETAPYYIQALQEEIDRLKIPREQGLKIFSNLSPHAQYLAQHIVPQTLLQLEKTHKNLTQLKSQGKILQALLINVDVPRAAVTALVGGRSFGQSQYNRALLGHRQVGSLMKPFVYLSALESKDPNGQDYTPLTLIDDSSWEYQYQGQKWSPQNYEKTFLGLIPLFYALKNSINVPTAKLGVNIGLSSIVDIAKRLGIHSKVQPLPSLTLGAFELFPMEVAQAYTSIANMGQWSPLHTIEKITDLKGQVLYEYKEQPQQMIAKENVAVLIGMLKQTLLNGTAKSSKYYGINFPAAGKTGTTSQTKDAWFIGFTPEILTLVWVGYDDNTENKLTGASGALPIWSNFMRELLRGKNSPDFNWPEDTALYHLNTDAVKTLIPHPSEEELQGIDLVFRKRNLPQ